MNTNGRNPNRQAQILRDAASQGRGNDTQLTHENIGEVNIPPGVIDENPNLMSAIIKAFRNSGHDWRKFQVGHPSNSTNPNTGLAEFDEGDPGGDHAGDTGGASDGSTSSGVGAGTPGARDNDNVTDDSTTDPGRVTMAPGAIPDGPPPGTQLEGSQRVAMAPGGVQSGIGRASDFLTGLLSMSPVANALTAAGVATGALPGDTKPAMVSGIEGMNRAMDGIGTSPGMGEGAGGSASGGHNDPRVQNTLQPQSTVSSESPASPIPQAPALPQFLQALLNLSPLQQRSAIATYGTQGLESGRYGEDDVKNFYKDLVQRNLGMDENPLPVEEQYINRLGAFPANTSRDAFLAALRGL